MAKLTVMQVKEHVETDLSDTALQRLIGDAYNEIERRFGVEPEAPSTTVIETIPGSAQRLFPSRPVARVVAVKETVGDVTTTLAADDYRVWFGGRMIERRSGGTNSRTSWGARVEVEYEPVSPTRDRVVIDLVKIAVQYQGVTRERAGDTSTDHLDYTKERERLLQSLAPSAFAIG